MSRRPTASRLAVVGLTATLGMAMSACARSPEPQPEAGSSTTDPAQVAEAIYQVVVEICDADADGVATGVAIEPDRLVTVAHVFEDSCSVTIIGTDGEETAASVVHLDTEHDLAFLEPAVDATAVVSLGPPTDGAEAAVFSAASGVVTAKEATVVREVDVIVDDGRERPALELRAELEPGDSGSPVVEPNGVMVGMVFASDRDEDTGWAVSAELILRLIGG